MHREELLQQLAPELRRRAGEAHAAQHDDALRILIQRDLVPEDADLLRLLLGFWSLADAYANGVAVPESHEDISGLWFPGGGTPMLPMPYPHYLDRY